MIMLTIMRKSLARRKGQVLVSTLAMAFSVMLLLTLGYIETSVHRYVKQLSSGTDLVVGAPAQPAYLVLYSLFGLGSSPPAIPFSVYDSFVDHPEISQAVAVSSQESHRGVAVHGVTDGYLDVLGLIKEKETEITGINDGAYSFNSPSSVFIGANVAKEFQYQQGEQMTLAHGFSPSFGDEYQMPFTIQAIFPATASLLDDLILVSMEGLKLARNQHGYEITDQISYVLVKLHNRQALLAMQQVLGNDSDVPVEVAVPGIELETFARYEHLINSVMLVMSVIIGVLALIMVFFNLSASFAERKQELELLRMVGARPLQIANLTLAEPLCQIVVAIVLGTLLYLCVSFSLQSFLPMLTSTGLTAQQLSWIVMVFICGLTVACLPAWKMYAVSKRI